MAQQDDCSSGEPRVKEECLGWHQIELREMFHSFPFRRNPVISQAGVQWEVVRIRRGAFVCPIDHGAGESAVVVVV